MHILFLTWPRACSHILPKFYSLIIMLHGKTFCWFCFKFPIFHTSLFLFQETEEKFLFIYAGLFFDFRPFWFSDHIVSSCYPLICVYLKYPPFLLFFVRNTFFQVPDHYYWFSLESLDFAVTFWRQRRRRGREESSAFELLPGGPCLSPSTM